MNRANQELRGLLKKLDSIIDEMRQVLVSTKLVSTNKKAAPYFLTKGDKSDVEHILAKIDKYKKLRKENHDSYNSELEVASVMDIFANTEILIKNISEGRSVTEYAEKGFFNRFSDISHEIERLIA